MRESKKHSFVAWVVDAYVTEMILSYLDHVAGIGWYETLAIPTFILTIVYHVFLAQRTVFRSFGEHIVGAFVENGEKVHRNPFQISRGLLWFSMIVNFADIKRGSTPLFIPPDAIAIFVAYGILFVVGYILLNKANIVGLVIVVSLILIKISRSLVWLFDGLEKNNNLATVFSGVYFAVLVFCVVVPIWYFRKRSF